MYPVGTVKIVDVEDVTHGWMNAQSISATNLDLFKSIRDGLIAKVPLVGDVYETGSETYGWIEMVSNDLNALDPYKKIMVETKYSPHDFKHNLYVWGTHDSWELVGYSISEYVYRGHATFYIDTAGKEQVSGAVEDNASIIYEAPHYKDYNYLRTAAYNAWNTGQGYYENYWY